MALGKSFASPERPAENVEQVATASARGVVQQAGHDLVNVSFHLDASQESQPSLVSIEPPRHRSRKVRGRDEIVAMLEREILDPAGRVLVFHGGGGFGKTTLALEAARLASRWEMHIWWISASDITRLNAGMREIALRLGIPAEEISHAWSGRASAPDLLWGHLNKSGRRWILLIDDANEPQALSAPDQRLRDGTGWLRSPPPGRGTVIVTSRDGNRAVWGEHCDLQRVDSLDEVSGAKVLVDLAGSDAGAVGEARSLSVRLGGLPLALHIAGTYLAYSARGPRLPGSAAPRTFACYESALEKQFAATIDRLPPGDREPRAENEIVTRTWELSLDLLARQGHPRARTLMRFLACFSQAPVPCEVLDAREMRSLSAFGDLTPEELLRLIHILVDFGLIDSFEDEVLGSHALVLHPLVRETNLHHLDPRDVDDHVLTLLRVLEAALEAVDPLVRVGRERWIGTAVHGGAPLALMVKMSTRTGANEVLARAALLDYVAQLFLEFDHARNYLELHRHAHAWR